MGIGKLIALFGIILIVFTGIVFYQYNAKSIKNPAVKIPSSKVTINKHKFKVTLAKTQKEQQAGLSTRTSLPQDQGMLFIFDNPDYYNFWMKNMKFPIDIIFIRDDKIVSIVENAQPPESQEDNLPLLKPEGLVDQVLEINAGLSKKYNIKKGDSLKIEL